MTTMTKCRNGHDKPKARPCPICSAARNAAFAADPTDPRHGTQNGYVNLQCRCAPCTAAWRSYRHAWSHADPHRLERKAELERARRGAAPYPTGHLTTNDIAAALDLRMDYACRIFEPSVKAGRRLFYAPDDLRRQVQEKINARWGGLLALLEDQP